MRLQEKFQEDFPERMPFMIKKLATPPLDSSMLLSVCENVILGAVAASLFPRIENQTNFRETNPCI